MMNYQTLQVLKKVNQEIAQGLHLYAETVILSENRMTNLYWVEIKKDEYMFDLAFASKLKPLKDMSRSNTVPHVAINIGSFFLSDDGIDPMVHFYNLAVQDGDVLQFQSNSRSSLLVGSGMLTTKVIEAQGEISIGNRKYTWSGTNIDANTQLKVYGMFDVDVCVDLQKTYGRRRQIQKNKMLVTSDGNDLLLGITLTENVPHIKIVSDKALVLTEYAYVIKGPAKLLSQCEVGDTIVLDCISGIEVTKRDSICAASFSIGHGREELISNLNAELVHVGMPKPIEETYEKSWSVVLETADSHIFFLNDARPQVPNQEGITVFELQSLLEERFQYKWGVVCDSGQSGKLLVSDGKDMSIYGNLHYINYRHENPHWDGENGRPISVGLFAYGK